MRYAIAAVVGLAMLAAAGAWAVAKDSDPIAPPPIIAAPKADAPAKDAAAPAATDPEALRKAREEAARLQKEYAKTRFVMQSGRPKLDFTNSPVKDALEALAERGKFSVVFDQALEQGGIDLAARPITIRLSGMTYEDAINLVLPKECGYRIEAGYVLITTLEKSWTPLKVGIYNIQLALAEVPDFGGQAPRFEVGTVAQAATQAVGGGGGGFGNIFNQAQAAPANQAATPDKIIDIIKKMVKNQNDRRIAPWDDEGGPATIQYSGGRLIITQTERGHRAIAKLLAQIE